MHRTPVKSSNVRSVGYDEATRQLHVEFSAKDARMPGRVYEYAGVSPDEHRALMSAQSIGTHFAAHIKSKHTGHLIQAP